mmetsp:Transcript_22551/g.51891  ORF Transcript_22551/g.51891 Transcript_22551/m.51891 type:complete len:180 (+) Transcript_22551:3-542(+)|eukprot:CAMPEP_0168749630 /NCGR_PEP_ID=MMETSP0724-20121128/16820_1 /TAXON_ID=265536 /ORGANISM="Amphiprora sp., Strain CCMP467" /LENGTH=179 /DNA_ID=CAMNT_0008797555 /DNA_START=36 /DNA_END=575 /DNA_ORIENTATION=+
MNTLLRVLILATSVTAFTAPTQSRSSSWATLHSSTQDVVEMSVSLPPSGSDVTAMMKITPCLPVPSKMIEVRYKLPFNLSVEPKNNLAVCTQAGPNEDSEQVGDVLRYTSQWTLGLPMGEGLAQTAGAFGGALQWGCTMFDVLGATDWRQVVEALTSNIPSRTDEVVLIFERPLEEAEA